MLLNLMELYGHAELTLGVQMPTARLMTNFVKYVSLNASCSIRVGARGGNMNEYVCTSSTPCDWRVVARRKHQPHGGSSFYSITELLPMHSHTCTSVAKPTERQLALLPTVVSMVRSNTAISRTDLVSTVQDLDGVNMESKVAGVYRVKDLIVNADLCDVAASTSTLPSILLAFERANPGSRVDFELDTFGRFYRAYVCCKVNANAHEFNLKLLGSDGAHFKHKDYNGVLLNLIGRDGNGKNVPLALGIVAKETSDNYHWFFTNCIQAGVNLTECATFVDRGKSQFAADALSRAGKQVCLKFCTRHIISNLKSKFALAGQVFENCIWRLQASDTELAYNGSLDAIGITHGDSVVSYLRDIDPVKWVVFANLRSATDHARRRLYKCRTTNFVESDNNKTLRNKCRQSLPAQAVLIWMDECAKDVTHRSKLAQKWLSEGRVVTPYASGIIDEQKLLAPSYKVIVSTDDVFFVFHPSRESKKRKVVLSEKSCTCTDNDQTGLPCRHIIRVLLHTDNMGLLHECSDHAYSIEAYCNAYLAKSIALPVYEDIVPDSVVKPSPIYRQAGRPVKRRIASRGEVSSGKTYKCRKCTGIDHNRATCNKHSASEEAAQPALPAGASYAGFYRVAVYAPMNMADILHQNSSDHDQPEVTSNSTDEQSSLRAAQ
ncbi:hypothetical protein AaE_013381 [Aphanomyces astaci]|uniref:SWIM-type domain-containing protein n=1 Tax=Aphanomyces astaci TaxID=112090 RepID=A0A6A4Z5E2_APHAT|nr:hypothetical protein AaE_013381 [Aphanomyces astaci]